MYPPLYQRRQTWYITIKQSIENTYHYLKVAHSPVLWPHQLLQHGGVSSQLHCLHTKQQHWWLLLEWKLTSATDSRWSARYCCLSLHWHCGQHYRHCCQQLQVTHFSGVINVSEYALLHHVSASVCVWEWECCVSVSVCVCVCVCVCFVSVFITYSVFIFMNRFKHVFRYFI